MLYYLVSSRSRRALLNLLWKKDEEGSVLELSHLAGVSYRSAHKELNEMKRSGLAEAKQVGNAVVFKAAADHPHAEVLRSLLKTQDAHLAANDSQEQAARQTRANLKRWGAPLEGGFSAAGNLPSLEQTLVEGVTLSHNDASVARSLPVCLWRNRAQLDLEHLRAAAQSKGEKHAVGFFLQLTGELADDSELVQSAEMFRDHRRRVSSGFFVKARSQSERKLAELRTPPVARRWQYLMNLDEQSFKSTFETFVRNETV